MPSETTPPAPDLAPHPRTLGWLGTTALAMGGSNQSLFLIGALIAGQGSIPGQGTAAIPLLVLGLVLSWMAAPGWTELVLMWPNRVGGIAATCAEAFRPYSPVLANLAGTCYWWGWIPTCGLTALLSASAIHQWYLPHVSVPSLACALVLLFMGVNLCGVRAVSRLVIPVATLSALLAFLSGVIPVVTGHVDWRQATTFHLATPFPGWFGCATSAMAGLYLVGFAAPAFEAAACHVGETVDPARNVPRAMFASGAMATVYFVLLPVVWLGALGPDALAGDLAQTLGPTFAPLLGGAAKAAAIWFMMFNMFHGTIQPLAGASRTLAQCAEDGLLPQILARRSRTDCPWVATLLTAGMAIAFLLAGDPLWLVAAANFAYLIGIGLPSVAVWLLRRNAPDRPRPWRAPDVTITLGLIAAIAWGVSTILGFEQFGLPTVLAGLALAYSGSALYALRRRTDRRRAGVRGPRWSLHAKLSGAMLLVLVLDGSGYLLAIHHVPRHHTELVTALADIFVVVALLTISVGLVLPGMISHAAEEVARAADRLATGTLTDFSRAMQALGRGDLEAAHARVDVAPVVVHSRDEVGAMAASFNTMQQRMAQAAQGLNDAREGLHQTRADLMDAGERYRSIFENAVEGIFQSAPDGRLLSVNPAGARMHGYDSPAEAVADLGDVRRQLYVNPGDRAEFADRLLRDGSIHNFETRFRRCDGSVFWVSMNARAVRDEADALQCFEGTIEDITERKSLEEERARLLAEALEQADRDPLTGLLNHRAFHKRLEEEADRALRGGGPLALAVLDLDNFKFFNDAYGHKVGDEVLRLIADALRRACRSYDVPARFGGDEFALLLPGAEGTSAALKADIEARLAGLSYRPEGQNSAIPLTLTVGLALFPKEAASRLDALELADARLRRCKTGGDTEETPAERLCAYLTQSVQGFSMLNALVTAVDNKDRYTRRHSEDVLAYSLQIAQALNLDAHAQHTIQVAALLHDVGKIGVPDAILRKPGRLTDEEFQAVQQHPMMGAIMVGAVPGFEQTLDAVRHHHERWDGEGYPFGLRGEDIPLQARIMAVADAFSAMTTDRPYRKGMDPAKARAILQDGAGTQWDSQCVEAFLQARADAPERSLAVAA